MQVWGKLAVVIVVLSLCHEGSVLAKDVSTKIWRGRRAGKFEFPFAVWLEIYQSERQRCGGSLVSSEYVLTSLGCFGKNGLLPSAFRVIVGDRRLKIMNNDEETNHTLTEVFTNQTVTLLKITPEANTDARNIDTVSLYSDKQLNGSETCYLTSFGYRRKGYDYLSLSKFKQKVQVEFLSAELCSDRPNYVAGESLCFAGVGLQAGRRKNPKACYGDEGSAIVCDVMGTYVQVAINTETSCESELHTARPVTDVISWVDDVVNGSL